MCASLTDTYLSLLSKSVARSDDYHIVIALMKTCTNLGVSNKDILRAVDTGILLSSRPRVSRVSSSIMRF